jgi:enamine deaminase RidA (YjgF/YER057c/UK114 family)
LALKRELIEKSLSYLIMFTARASSRLTAFASRQMMLRQHHPQPSTIRNLSGIQRIGTENPNMSAVVVNNGIVYTSGQVDTKGKDVVEQTQNVLATIDNLLAQAGTDKSKLLTANIWLKNIEQDFGSMNKVWAEWLDSDNKPVRATVEAPMATPAILVEVQVTAAAK